MRDLYAATALLALNAQLRDNVQAAAKLRPPDNTISPHPALPRLQEQPDLNALRTISDLFRAQNLVLGAYSLAEINRWMVTGGQPFVDALIKLGTELAKVLTLQPSAAHDAAGALVADERLLDEFRAMRDLRTDGFKLTVPEQEGLRGLFPIDSPASLAAKEVFTRGWTTGTCASAFLVWEGMFHTNI